MMDYTYHEGPATKKLAEIIPIENIRLYLAYYLAMKKINLQGDDRLSYEKVYAALQVFATMFDRGAMTEKETESVMELLLNKYFNNLALFISPSAREGRRQKSRDYPFEFLLKALVFDAGYYSPMPGRVYYDLIVKFLKEQDVAGYSARDIEKKSSRISYEDVRHSIAAHLTAGDEQVFQQAFDLVSATRHDPKDGFLANIFEDLLPQIIGPFKDGITTFEKVKRHLTDTFKENFVNEMRGNSGVVFTLKK